MKLSTDGISIHIDLEPGDDALHVSIGGASVVLTHGDLDQALEEAPQVSILCESGVTAQVTQDNINQRITDIRILRRLEGTNE